MKTQIEKLKQELREFIELSKTITPSPWEYNNDSDDMDSDGGWIYAPDRPLLSKGNTSHTTMIFIARSRNISPVMAECLLAAVEGLDSIDDCAYCQAGHEEECQNSIKQILNIWEAAK